MTEPESVAGGNFPDKLNVLFHGLWAYEFHDTEIIVRTTQQRDHRVAAGNWVPDYELKAGKQYQLAGIRDANFAVSSAAFERQHDLNAIFKDKEVVNNADLFCTIRLPLPLGFHSLRPVEFNKNPYTGPDSGPTKDTRKIAVVQVFTFAADLSSLRLIEEDSNGARQSQALQLPKTTAENTGNFYFFAQPSGRVHSNHFHEAVEKLAALYGLKIFPVPASPRGPSNPGIPGLTWRDEVGLNERATVHPTLAPAAISSGSGCDPFVIDNRTPAALRQLPAQLQTYSKSD